MLTDVYVRCRCQRKIVLATSVNTRLKENVAVVIFVSSLRQEFAIFTDLNLE
jgi:hypothetical protein